MILNEGEAPYRALFLDRLTSNFALCNITIKLSGLTRIQDQGYGC